MDFLWIFKGTWSAMLANPNPHKSGSFGRSLLVFLAAFFLQNVGLTVLRLSSEFRSDSFVNGFFRMKFEMQYVRTCASAQSALIGF